MFCQGHSFLPLEWLQHLMSAVVYHHSNNMWFINIGADMLCRWSRDKIARRKSLWMQPLSMRINFVCCESSQICHWQVLWNATGSLVVYPCHAVVVAMQANNGQQRFFIGHTDKVSISSSVCAIPLFCDILMVRLLHNHSQYTGWTFWHCCAKLSSKIFLSHKNSELNR